MSRLFSVTSLAILAAVLGGTTVARAQGLGDVASRERQKREAQKSHEPGRAYGNEDLPGQSADKTGKKKDEAAPAGTSAAPPVAPSGEDSADDAGSVFAARKQRVADAEAAVRSAQAMVDGIESRIRQLQDMLNPMSPSFIYGATASGDMANAEARAREELRQSETRLAEARKALAAANQELEDAQLGRMPSPQS
jgi:hypothetical protein